MRSAILTATAGLAVVAFASQAGRGNTDALSRWVSELSAKKAISATVTAQVVGGAASTYSIEVAKPNLLRLDTSKELIVANGKTITVFDKKTKIYYSKPQDAAELGFVLADDEYAMWRPFFGSALKATSAKNAGNKTIGGESVTQLDVSVDAGGKKRQTFYVSTDAIARRAELNLKTKDGGTSTTIYLAKNVSVSDAVKSDLFAFNAPSDAKEVKYEDLIASKWFDDLDEALAVAEKTGRKVFVDFMADWCGPCKKMDAEVFTTDGFKSMSKKLVFVKIDIDRNPMLADKYGVEAIPNMFVLNANGAAVGSILGYMPAEIFLEKLEALAQ